MRIDKKGREIPQTMEEKKEVISFISKVAFSEKGIVRRKIISEVTELQAIDLLKIGIDLQNDNWVHSIETSAIIHTKKNHSDPDKEAQKGQIAITDKDFFLIPEILDSYDCLYKSDNKSHAGKNTVLIYEKRFRDITVCYIEEKRDGRKSLAFHTMYKKI